ncbi:MAG: hypothetical protein HRT35_02155 [Algicola sp.]|nr:hypothetical protein [Algicola sp.]
MNKYDIALIELVGPSYSILPTPVYEGVGAGGDSGGLAYIETDAGRFVAGVSSFGSRHYKEFDNYTRVSTSLDWLAEVMSTDYPGSYS